MKVCIESQEDGTYSVYEEPADDAAEDSSGAAAQLATPAMPPAAPMAEGDDTGAQTADNVDDALAMAKQMLEQSGDDSAPEDMSNGSEPMQPDQAKAYWNQMAAKKQKAKASMGAM